MLFLDQDILFHPLVQKYIFEQNVTTILSGAFAFAIFLLMIWFILFITTQIGKKLKLNEDQFKKLVAYIMELIVTTFCLIGLLIYCHNLIFHGTLIMDDDIDSFPTPGWLKR